MLAAATMVAAGIIVPATLAAAGRCEAVSVYLSDFPPLMAGEPPFFYYTAEKEGNARGEVTAFIGCGNGSTYSARYDTPAPVSPDAADAGDYDRVSGTPEFVATQDHLVLEEPFQVPIHQDGAVETLAERVSVQLSEYSSGVTPGEPAQAPLYIVDDDGQERVRFLASQVTVPESAGVVRIPVLRAGNLDGGVGFSVAPAMDVTPTGGSVQLAGDGRFGIVKLTILDDSQAEPLETVTVSLSGAAVEGGAFSLAITDDDTSGGDDTTAPHAWFDPPRHELRYSHEDLHSIRLLATDDSGRAAIDGAQAALRKKLKAGGCKWWKGGRWQAKACSSVQWFSVSSHHADGIREVFVPAPLPEFTPSVGPRTRIRNYRVYGRVTDDAGNTSPLVTGENRNTFEVTRG